MISRGASAADRSGKECLAPVAAVEAAESLAIRAEEKDKRMSRSAREELARA